MRWNCSTDFQEMDIEYVSFPEHFHLKRLISLVFRSSYTVSVVILSVAISVEQRFELHCGVVVTRGTRCPWNNLGHFAGTPRS